MPFSDDHADLTAAVGAMRSGFNPDGRRGSGELDMAPDLWRRMMRGEITPVEARREWAEREPAQRRFNDQLRSAAGVGFVADAEAVLSQAGTTGAPVSARDEQTGRFADLNQAARDAGSQPVPGGIVPAEQPVKPEDPFRAAYHRLLERRAKGEVE